jgi:hypothetical protein
MDKKIDLVIDNIQALALSFNEKLDYLKGYFEYRYKPLNFIYQLNNVDHRLRILSELKGKQRKISIGIVIDASSSPKYNFDIVEKYIEQIKHKMENEIINEGIKSLN